jgi:hypothetical protein
MKRMSILAVVMMISAMSLSTSISMQGQTDTAKPKDAKAAKHAPAKKETDTEKQLHELKEMMQAQMKMQQAEIDALKAQLAGKDTQVAAAQQSATAAKPEAATATAAAASASAAAQQSATKVDAISSTVADPKSTDAGLTETVVTQQNTINEAIESPTVIHYKGITITPVAFFAAEGVYRQHSVNSDVNTPFNSIEFPSALEGHISELNFTGRQSRLGGLFEGNVGNFKLTGYAEMDFLGTGTSSNNNQSNSYVLRQRQIWGKGETKAGFAVTGGQTWSLVTENRRSVDTRTEIQPQTIDSQYLVGYSWTRQPGFRIQQKFGDLKTGMFSMGLSVEQAQITSFTANGTNPAEYFFAGPGQNGGLYNAAGNIGNGNAAGTGGITTYANNVAPDVIVKAAFDVPTFHFEIGGLGRWLRDYYYPVTAYTGTAAAPTYTYATSYVHNTKSAGGVFGSARFYAGKFAEIAVQAMAGQGVGRYGSSQLADATLRPDETLEPVRNYHGLFSLETHPAPKLDVFFYYGGEYAQRTVYTTPQGALIGYGPANLSNAGCYNLPAFGGTSGTGGSISSATCGSPTRYIQEAMGGLTYRVYASPKFGCLQYQFTYSYLQRNLWSGVGSTTTPAAPRATDPMLHVSMRYYIP